MSSGKSNKELLEVAKSIVFHLQHAPSPLQLLQLPSHDMATLKEYVNELRHGIQSQPNAHLMNNDQLHKLYPPPLTGEHHQPLLHRQSSHSSQHYPPQHPAQLYYPPQQYQTQQYQTQQYQPQQYQTQQYPQHPQQAAHYFSPQYSSQHHAPQGPQIAETRFESELQRWRNYWDSVNTQQGHPPFKPSMKNAIRAVVSRPIPPYRELERLFNNQDLYRQGRVFFKNDQQWQNFAQQQLYHNGRLNAIGSVLERPLKVAHAVGRTAEKILSI